MTMLAFRADDIAEERPQALQTTYHVESMDALSPSNIEQWSALCRSDFQYGSPLLTPEFARFIAEFREDVRVVLALQAGRLVGVLPVHQRSFGHTRPIGAPYCDYSGPLIRRGAALEAADFLQMAGYASYRSQTSVVVHAPNELVEPVGQEGTYVIRLKDRSPEAYLESRRVLHPKRFKNFRRLLSKLEREQGALGFVSGAPADLGVESLLKWKSEQFEREGLLDLTSAKLSHDVLDHAIAQPFETPSRIGGFMTGIRLNGRLIAGHFGVRLGSDFHPWISAFDPEFTEFSPGVLLLYRVIEEMSAMGLETYDLAGGHDFYKKYFADQERFVREISVASNTLLGRLQQLSYESWRVLGADNTDSIAGRTRRRIDHAAACEHSLTARVRDFIRAVRQRGRVTEAVGEGA